MTTTAAIETIYSIKEYKAHSFYPSSHYLDKAYALGWAWCIVDNKKGISGWYHPTHSNSATATWHDVVNNVYELEENYRLDVDNPNADIFQWFESKAKEVFKGHLQLQSVVKAVGIESDDEFYHIGLMIDNDTFSFEIGTYRLQEMYWTDDVKSLKELITECLPF